MTLRAPSQKVRVHGLPLFLGNSFGGGFPFFSLKKRNNPKTITFK